MKSYRGLQYLGSLLVIASFWFGAVGLAQPAQAEAPAAPVKLIFIHHSSGENWLSDDQGGLARALQANNYFVSDTNYGWGPDSIGDRTDIVNWPEWFRSPQTETYMAALFAESGVNSPYARSLSDPGGENQIVMFKSCFPNSDLSGNPDDPPRQEDGLTVSNAKYIYNDLLEYFATRPDKLFVVITAPPLINPSQPENARAFNTWLVQDWLAENNYTLNNVAVFDYYNVLTDPDNHHRLVDGQVEYVTSHGNDRLHYDTDGDDHANPEGNRKATEEFLSLLNSFYQTWSATAPQQPLATQPQSQADATQAPAQPTAPPARPGAPVGEGLIADFETGDPSWEAFWQDASETKLTCAPATGEAYSGSQALLIDFNVQPDTWATCELNLGENQDWSAGRSLSFAIHASDPAMVVEVLLFGGDPGARVPYSFKLETTPEMVSGWGEVELTWDMLVQPEYEASPGTPVDPTKVNGVAFAFNTYPDSPSVGKIWVDDLRLAGLGAQEAEAPATARPAEETSPPAQEEATTLPKEAEKEKGGGLCSAPLFLTGLVLIGVGWVRKKSSASC
jgi:hypothetical protein